MSPRSRILVVGFLLLGLVGCAKGRVQPVWDPLEPMNRGIFWFNDKADIYVVEPVARGYDETLPDPVKKSIRNFFANLRSPLRLVSALMQFKFEQAAEVTGRFLVNTTLGGAGLFDPATDMGLEANEDDIGVALGYHGVPEGPYVVLPIMGPSNLRDAVGRIGNVLLDPFFWIAREGDSSTEKTVILTSLYALDLIDTRASLIEAVETAKSSSLDYYLFMQSSYHQYRLGLIYDGDVPEEEEFTENVEPKEPAEASANNE